MIRSGFDGTQIVQPTLPLIAIMSLERNTLHGNWNVDFVIVYRFSETSESRNRTARRYLTRLTFIAKKDASRSFENLVQALARVGLAIQVRNGENCSLLVFVKVVSDDRLNNAVYRSRCVCTELRMAQCNC